MMMMMMMMMMLIDGLCLCSQLKSPGLVTMVNGKNRTLYMSTVQSIAVATKPNLKKTLRGTSRSKAQFPLPELTGDRFPLPVNTGRVDWRPVSTSRVDGPCWRVVETGLNCQRKCVYYWLTHWLVLLTDLVTYLRIYFVIYLLTYFMLLNLNQSRWFIFFSFVLVNVFKQTFVKLENLLLIWLCVIVCVRSVDFCSILASIEQWCWSGGRGILTELSL